MPVGALVGTFAGEDRRVSGRCGTSYKSACPEEMAERDFRRCWGTPAALHRGRALHRERSATFLRRKIDLKPLYGAYPQGPVTLVVQTWLVGEISLNLSRTSGLIAQSLDGKLRAPTSACPCCT
jgi:hypothetical protein